MEKEQTKKLIDVPPTQTTKNYNQKLPKGPKNE
jgi:hypothetical protein